ncbi:S-methyl-5-thioribose-1-phosphate isomerase [Pseudomonas aeruginosa]
MADSRPTAVNQFWALNRMARPSGANERGATSRLAVLGRAISIHESDREANLTMAQLGMELIRKQQRRPAEHPTHCNTGALATGGFGTALGVIRRAPGRPGQSHLRRRNPAWLQGSRLTACGAGQRRHPVSLNVDSAAAHLMKTENITWVIVGADRITANGDVANKIGTYQLAVNAMHHGVRFMVVAPSSTIDMNLESGEDIPIEERDGRELLEIGGRRVAAEVDAYNPVFGVTPADLIDAIVTERGVVERPDAGARRRPDEPQRLH